MDELESLIQELQQTVRKVVSSPPANYVRVHEWPGGYSDTHLQSDGVGSSAGGVAVLRENMDEIERMLSLLDEPYDTQTTNDLASQRSSACPSFTLESLMNDLKEFQLEHELTLGNRMSALATTQPLLQLPAAAAAAAAPSSPRSKTGSQDGSRSSSTGGLRCADCQEQILGQMVHALGRSWHMEHFLCAGCRTELGRQTFYEVSGHGYCEPCYQAEYSPKCAQCAGPILDRCLTAMGRQWHPEHFFCHQCTAPFSETCGFHERDGKPYCLDCYSDAFSPKCRGCGGPITANYVTAMGKMWHPDCFVCKDCGRDLGGGGNYYELDGQPYCEQHYHASRGTLCITCERPIASRCITAMGRKFHPECFLCAFCNNQLSRGAFKEKENKPYCSECYAKLFYKK